MSIEKELAQLALKSSQSRASNWYAYHRREVFPKWHKIQDSFTNISLKEFCPRHISKPKAAIEKLSGIARKLCSPLRCTISSPPPTQTFLGAHHAFLLHYTISCSARFVCRDEIKGDKMMSTTTEMQNACCFAHHSPGPSTNLKTNSQPHIRPQTAGFFFKNRLSIS